MIRRQRTRRRRLQAKEIPYVVGEAVGARTGFYGREEYLAKLRNSIKRTSCAITGEFRIGKTSLQLELKKQLEQLEDPEYAYIPC